MSYKISGMGLEAFSTSETTETPDGAEGIEVSDIDFSSTNYSELIPEVEESLDVNKTQLILRTGVWSIREWFVEGSPHEPPLVRVPERFVTDLEYVTDEDIVRDAVKYMRWPSPDEYEYAIKTYYNDFMVIYWPFRRMSNSKYSEITSFLRDKIKEIKTWKALQLGLDPEQVETEWKSPWKVRDIDWEQLFDDEPDEEIGKYDIIERYSAVSTPKDEQDYSWMDGW